MTAKNKKIKRRHNPPGGIDPQLYELRRELVMREAHTYVGGSFVPRSADGLFRIVSAGNRESGFVLQVY